MRKRRRHECPTRLEWPSATHQHPGPDKPRDGDGDAWEGRGHGRHGLSLNLARQGVRRGRVALGKNVSPRGDDIPQRVLGCGQVTTIIEVDGDRRQPTADNKGPGRRKNSRHSRRERVPLETWPRVSRKRCQGTPCASESSERGRPTRRLRAERTSLSAEASGLRVREHGATGIENLPRRRQLVYKVTIIIKNFHEIEEYPYSVDQLIFLRNLGN